MTLRSAIARIVMQEDLNFLLTNRLPRRLATRFVGWLSKIEHPLVKRASIATWKLFSEVDLSDAATNEFRSMHDCFIRALKPGARIFDPDPAVLASPSDGIIGAHGRVEGDEILQVKGMAYSLSELLGSPDASRPFLGGQFVTLRLNSGMYHRFHAPAQGQVDEVTYLSGDCWNVNPIALKRVERLFCRNERAAIRMRLPDGTPIMLVAVAAILVAGIRLTFLDTPDLLRVRGPGRVSLDVPLLRGVEMGWFEHGSTIIMLAPAGWEITSSIDTGGRISAGQALFRRG